MPTIKKIGLKLENGKKRFLFSTCATYKTFDIINFINP